jgi:membrane protease YdiL (CAAX protease family)
MKKITFICIITIFLVIPIFFGVYIEFFLVSELQLYTIQFLVLGFFLLLFVGWIINNFGFNQSSIELMRNHNVVNALINNKYINLWLFFPITIVMEELIFRYYLLSFLTLILQLRIFLSILISSIIFSFYHIHTWFTYKSQKILLINLSYTLMLGFFIGYIFFMLGFIPCIIIHYLVAFYLYYNLYRKNFNKTKI